MAEATATVHQLCDTPAAAITFIEAEIRGKKLRVDALKGRLRELMGQPNPVHVRAVEQILQTMESELETEWAQLVAFREDFDIP